MYKIKKHVILNLTECNIDSRIYLHAIKNTMCKQKKQCQHLKEVLAKTYLSLIVPRPILHQTISSSLRSVSFSSLVCPTKKSVFSKTHLSASDTSLALP